MRFIVIERVARGPYRALAGNGELWAGVRYLREQQALLRRHMGNCRRWIIHRDFESGPAQGLSDHLTYDPPASASLSAPDPWHVYGQLIGAGVSANFLQA